MFIVLMLVIGFSAFVQGVTSFGFSLIALPLMALWMPMQEIVPLLVVCSIVLNVIMLTNLYKHVVLRLIGALLIGGFSGIFVGIWLLDWVSSDVLKFCAGVVILLVSIVLLLGKKWELASPKKFYLPLGFVSGIMQGSLSLSGPPLVLFLSNQGVEKQTFRANLTAYFSAMNLLSLPIFLMSGKLNAEVGWLSLWALPAMVVGTLLGSKVASRMPEDLFRRVSLILMCVAGAMAVITSLT